MASSKLRTHQGKSISYNDGSRSTITGLRQRNPTADQLQRLSRSLQSVRLDGGVLTLVATEKAGCRWPESHVQTPFLARANAITGALKEGRESHSAVSEFVIDDNESEGDPSDTREVNLDGARHSIRGFDEL